MDLLVAIPCYNEANTILKVYQELQSIENAEIRVFLDGSSDGTDLLVKTNAIPYHLEEENVGLSRNFNIIIDHFLSNSNYKHLLIVDGDGQFPFSEIKKILHYRDDTRYDFVSGSRFMTSKDMLVVPWIKRIGNKIIAKTLTNLLQVKNGRKSKNIISDPSCGLRLYSRKAALSLNMEVDHSYTIQSWIRVIEDKLNFKEVPIRVIYYQARKSAISSNLLKYGSYVMRIITNNWLNLRFRFFLRLCFSTLLLGIIFIIAFVLESVNSSQFSGNLYLAASGGFLSVISLNSLMFFYLLRLNEGNNHLYRIFLDMKFSIQETESSTLMKTHCERCSK